MRWRSLRRVAVLLIAVIGFFPVKPTFSAGPGDTRIDAGLSKFCLVTYYKELPPDQHVTLRLHVPDAYLAGVGPFGPSREDCAKSNLLLILLSFPDLKPLTPEERRDLRALSTGRMLNVTIMNLSGTKISLETRVLDHQVGMFRNRMQSIDAGQFDTAFKRLSAAGTDSGQTFFFKRENGILTSVRCQEQPGIPQFCNMVGTHPSIPHLAFEVLMLAELVSDHKRIRSGVEALLSDWFVRSQ
jgi:hypothetical protein